MHGSVPIWGKLWKKQCGWLAVTCNCFSTNLFFDFCLSWSSWRMIYDETARSGVSSYSWEKVLSTKQRDNFWPAWASITNLWECSCTDVHIITYEYMGENWENIKMHSFLQVERWIRREVKDHALSEPHTCLVMPLKIWKSWKTLPCGFIYC